MKKGTTLAQIDSVELADNRAVVKFKNNFGEAISAGIFFKDFKGVDTSYLLKQLAAATAEDATELFELTDNPDTLPSLVGRTVLLTIEDGEGLKLVNTSKGFKAGDYTAGTLTELVAMLKADGLKLQRPVVASIASNELAEKQPTKKQRNSRQDF